MYNRNRPLRAYYPSDMNTKAESGGIGFFGALTLIFIVLKLTGNITWSWWWVLSPLWLPIAAIFGFLVISCIIYAFVSAFTEKDI